MQPHALTLEFPDSALETGFDAEYRSGALRYYRMLLFALLGFMVGISLTGLVVEFSVNREGIQRLLWSALIPATAAALAALYVVPRPRWVVVGYVAGVGAVCILYPRFGLDPSMAATYGFSYLALLLFLMFAFSRLPPLFGLGLAAAFIAGYAAVLRGVPGVTWDSVVNHVSMLLGAAALGFAVGYLTELNQRRAYAARIVIEERERQLAEEKAKSEALLLSVLPQSIAARLKQEGRSIADGIVECTVLFCDLVGFTGLAQELGPRALVSLLNKLFSEFDELSDRHGLEKIKTIGDAYMVAGGVPEYLENHAAAIADMALDMRRALERFNAEHRTSLDVRIGVHSGPVIAGIIGTRKFSYDLWGDAVNTAARMESHGLPGRIQVTEGTALLLRRTHELEERGVIEVKGKGAVRTFWLVGRKP